MSDPEILTEVFYSMQYYCRTAHDPLIHCVMRLDLRKYCRGPLKPGLCNLTSNLQCRTAVGVKDTFEDTLTAVSRRM